MEELYRINRRNDQTSPKPPVPADGEEIYNEIRGDEIENREPSFNVFF